jgi:hypothetical protein
MNGQQRNILKMGFGGVGFSFILQLFPICYRVMINPPNWSWGPSLLIIGISCVLYIITLFVAKFVRRAYLIQIFYGTIFFIPNLLNWYGAWLFASISPMPGKWVVLGGGIVAAILGSIVVYRSTRIKFQNALLYNYASKKIDIKKGTFDLVVPLHLKNPDVEKRKKDSSKDFWKRIFPFLPFLGATINRTQSHNVIFLFMSALSLTLGYIILNEIVKFVATADEIRSLEKKIGEPLLIPDGNK